jgi:heme-degrading monooxygenase HmoA
MSEVYTNGRWTTSPGSEEAFVEAWRSFASWASGMDGAGTLRLVRDLNEPGQFVSFGDWQSIEQVRAWKSTPEFRENMAQVLQHVDTFKPSELELIAAVEDGAFV